MTTGHTADVIPDPVITRGTADVTNHDPVTPVALNGCSPAGVGAWDVIVGERRGTCGRPCDAGAAVVVVVVVVVVIVVVIRALVAIEGDC